ASRPVRDETIGASHAQSSHAARASARGNDGRGVPGHYFGARGAASVRSAMTKRTKLVLGLAGAVALAFVAVFLWRDHRDSGLPSLYVVNLTGADGLTVLVDGDVVVRGLANATVEEPRFVKRVRLPLGAHVIEARDADGNVIDTSNVAAQ